MRTSVTRCFTFEAAHQLPWRLEAADLDVACIRLWETADSMVEVRR
jgi:hypothetical protein